jgi:hypothetical protein
VKKQPAALSRRKLASVVRKAITSYYTEQKQQEIAQAAPTARNQPEQLCCFSSTERGQAHQSRLTECKTISSCPGGLVAGYFDSRVLLTNARTAAEI